MKLNAWHVGVLVVGVAIPLAVAAVRPAAIPVIEITWNAHRPQLPPDTLQDGTEFALVYIGSSSCVFCQSEELPLMIDDIRKAVAEEASRTGSGLVAVGVTADWDVERGLQHLRAVGPFHEVSTGRRWLNIGALKYVWEEYAGSAATPQIIVIRRSIRRNGVRSVSRGDLLVRKIGLDAIQAWSAAGAPLYLSAREIE